MNTPSSSDRQYDELVNEAIAYVKGGQKPRARRLLERATLVRADDARAWLWLSATTDDPDEQRLFLERAVAADPSNAAARRGLVMLSDRIKGEKVLAEGEQVQPLNPQEPAEVRGVAHRCPQCGGSLQFSLATQELTCSHCGYVQPGEKRTGAERLEQPVDFVMPTERGHRWAEAQQQVTCVDTRVQWSEARNIWHNAAIRTALYTPVTMLRRAFRRGKSYEK